MAAEFLISACNVFSPSFTSPDVCPVIIEKLLLTSLCVTGIPAIAGTAIAELMPGISSVSIPAALRYCISSEPLPNT